MAPLNGWISYSFYTVFWSLIFGMLSAAAYVFAHVAVGAPLILVAGVVAAYVTITLSKFASDTPPNQQV